MVGGWLLVGIGEQTYNSCQVGTEDVLFRGTTAPLWATKPLYSTIRSVVVAGVKPGGVRADARLAAAKRPARYLTETILRRD